jgi:hypothetical protein
VAVPWHSILVLEFRAWEEDTLIRKRKLCSQSVTKATAGISAMVIYGIDGEA